MNKMLMLPKAQRRLMGEKGRLKMELEFDEKIVIQKYVNSINCILKFRN
jgi:hypothetical protein